MAKEVLSKDGEFWIMTRPNEYRVTVDLRASTSQIIDAESIEDAKRKADNWCDQMVEDPDIELDEIDHTDRPFVMKTRPLFLVMREGKPMRTSHLTEGDTPREPDERGW